MCNDEEGVGEYNEVTNRIWADVVTIKSHDNITREDVIECTYNSCHLACRRDM